MEFLTPRPVSPVVFGDSRGSLEVLVECDGVTFKRSTSLANVFRGLHIQTPPFAQKKFIRVAKGKILDICLNLNRDSDDFGNLSYFPLEPSKAFLTIPEYYAHGFLTTSDTEFEYICIGQYCPDSEYTINISDIVKSLPQWPKPNEIIISTKDALGVPLDVALSHFSSVKWNISSIQSAYK